MQDTTTSPNGTSTLEETVRDLVHKVDTALGVAAAVQSGPAIEPFISTRPRIVEPVPIELDRVRHLRLPFWALKKFQQVTGKSPWDHDAVWGYPPDLDITCAMIWCGLLEEDPTLTIEQVERLPGMEFGNIHYLRHVLDECWGRNNPDAVAGEAPKGGAGDPNPPGDTASTG